MSPCGSELHSPIEDYYLLGNRLICNQAPHGATYLQVAERLQPTYTFSLWRLQIMSISYLNNLLAGPFMQHPN